MITAFITTIACLFASLFYLMWIVKRQAGEISMLRGWNERLQDENRKLKAMHQLDSSRYSDDDIERLLQNTS